MDEFHKTRMGHRFFEQTMPELVRAVHRLADAIERVVAARDWPKPEEDDTRSRGQSV